MILMAAKISKRKLLLLAALILAVGMVLVLCLHGAAEPGPAGNTSAAALDTDEARIAYLQGFGWEVRPEPVQSQQVRVPDAPSEVFLRYNELQKSQGYDLTQYAGKLLDRYVYEITNYPADDGVYYATLLLYQGEVVGADVSSSAQGGVMHALAGPAQS